MVILLPAFSFSKKFRIWLLTKPLISTTSCAYLLAIMWTITWFIVLLFLTYATQTATPAPVLVGGLLLSTVAEGLIRTSETSKIAEKYSTGNLNATKSDFHVGTAAAFLFAGVIIVLLFDDSISFPKEFELAPSTSGFFKILPEWIIQFKKSPIMVVSLGFCVIVRTLIYKKSHKNWIKPEVKNKEVLSTKPPMG